jgi:uncharacterized protein
MSPSRPPLLTCREAEALEAARAAGDATLSLSLDLGVSTTRIEATADHWTWEQQRLPYPGRLRERTVYAPGEDGWQALSRYSGALIKLVPTDWGPPTFEIDGIKMLPTAKISPLADAREKVALIRPEGARVLDCCGGLGYFARACLEGGAASIRSFEKNPDVLWLRGQNPWSPPPDPRLRLEQADVCQALAALPDRAFDAALHDPPRFGIAGELYSAEFYAQLARVLAPGARLFHYTGTPNRLTSGRDVPGEVSRRLERAGFETRRQGDGIVGRRRRRTSPA